MRQVKQMNTKVLVIDDEEEIGTLLTSVLCSLGFIAEHRPNLKSGLAAFESEKHDIVFLDLRLPDGDGFSIIPLLKKRNANANIIIITAHGAQEEKQRAYSMGANYFLQKPFNIGQVQHALCA